MGVSTAPATPNLTGTFVPEIWSGKLLVKFYAATVCAAISNTDYEGEIKNKGDKIIIRQNPDITIRDYDKNAELLIEHPETEITELEIDKAKYFSFICDDIDKYQSDIPLMDKWSEEAGEQMKIAIDTQALADIYAQAHASNRGAAAGAKSGGFNLGTAGSPLSVTKTTALDTIVDAGTVLDEQNVPETGRWIVIPPWLAGLVKKSDLKDASLAGDDESVLRNGRLGMIDRFTVYVSNLLTSVSDGGDTCYHAIAGHKSGLAWAAQMTRMESVKSAKTFGTIVRGLNVYGYGILRPEAIVDLYVTKG